MRRRKILYVAFIGIACGGQALDVGETDPGTGGTGGTGGAGGTGGSMYPVAPLPTWPSPTDCVATSTLDITGVWEGAVQDEQFRNVLPLRVEILGASELGGICGTVRWGEGPTPPPPTDPEEGWPDNSRIGFGGASGYFHEGSTFTILDGGVRVLDVSQARFRVAAQETWKPWCAIQPSYWLEGALRWSCLPDYATLSTSSNPNADCILHTKSGQDISVDHGKCGICLSEDVCVCNETGCAANPAPASTVAAYFDLTFDADRGIGTVEGGISLPSSNGDPEWDVLLNRVE